MRLITFSGIDGSGKSSQLALLQKSLEDEGRRVAYFHAVQFSLPQAAKHFFQRSPTKPGEAKAKTKSGPLGVWLRKIVLLTDLIRFRSFWKNLEKSGVQYLLSDRYFYDSLVNIAYLDGTALDTPYARFAMRFIPRPTTAFYLRATPKRVIERERSPEQGLTYLEDKTKLFDEAATLWSFVTINADETLDTVTSTVKHSL